MRFYEGNTVADWDVDPNAVSCPYQDAPEVGKWGWKQDADGKWYRELAEGQKPEDPPHGRS